MYSFIFFICDGWKKIFQLFFIYGWCSFDFGSCLSFIFTEIYLIASHIILKYFENQQNVSFGVNWIWKYSHAFKMIGLRFSRNNSGDIFIWKKFIISHSSIFLNSSFVNSNLYCIIFASIFVTIIIFLLQKYHLNFRWYCIGNKNLNYKICDLLEI